MEISNFFQIKYIIQAGSFLHDELELNNVEPRYLFYNMGQKIAMSTGSGCKSRKEVEQIQIFFLATANRFHRLDKY